MKLSLAQIADAKADHAALVVLAGSRGNAPTLRTYLATYAASIRQPSPLQKLVRVLGF